MKRLKPTLPARLGVQLLHSAIARGVDGRHLSLLLATRSARLPRALP
jgi:hypothetical protein